MRQVWTSSTAAEASIKLNPVYVILYCVVFAIREAKNIFLRKPLGIGNHQTKSNATKVNLKPINKKGGRYSMAGLAITKPNPKKIGTIAAIKVSRRVKF